MLCMIFDIIFSIFNFFLLFFNFHFSKQSFLGIFDFWLKTPPNHKSCTKTVKIINLPSYLSHFIKKKSTFLCWTFFLGPLTWNCPKEELQVVLICWHLDLQVLRACLWRNSYCCWMQLVLGMRTHFLQVL